MSRRKRSEQPYKGQITTPVPSWLSSSDAVPVAGSSELSLELEKICLPPSQPRRYFDPQSQQELVESVRQHGILQPLLVRPLSTGEYELVAGERRYRAAKEVGLSQVPALVKELSDEEAIQLALVENLQREDLNPVEETEGILALLALRLRCEVGEVKSLLYRMKNEQERGEKGTESAPLKARRNVSPHEEVANAEAVIPSSLEDTDFAAKFKAVQEVFDRLGGLNWLSFTTKRLPLLKLPPEVLEALRTGKIAYTKASALARVKDEKLRQQLLEEAIASDWSLSQLKAQIKERTQAAASPPTPPKAQQLSERLKAASQKVRKSKLGENPKKQKQLEKLLTQLEALISNLADAES